jgi:hypothetical protein
VIASSDNRMERLDAFIAEFGETWGVVGGSLQTRNAVGDAVIHLLAARGEAELLELAISMGESPDALDEFGMTPMHHAANSLAWDAIEKLVALGADPDRCDDSGRTPSSMIPRGLDIPAHISTLLGVARKRRTSTRS